MREWALVLVCMTAGCAITHTQRREQTLVELARGFNDDLRWARWEAIATNMPREEGAAFLARAASLDDDLVMADYEVTAITFRDQSRAADVVARFDWYTKREPTLRTTTLQQRWEYSDGRWVMVKQRRTRGDRLGLVTEPLSSTTPGQTERNLP